MNKPQVKKVPLLNWDDLYKWFKENHKINLFDINNVREKNDDDVLLHELDFSFWCREYLGLDYCTKYFPVSTILKKKPIYQENDFLPNIDEFPDWLICICQIIHDDFYEEFDENGGLYIEREKDREEKVDIY